MCCCLLRPKNFKKYLNFYYFNLYLLLGTPRNRLIKIWHFNSQGFFIFFSWSFSFHSVVQWYIFLFDFLFDVYLIYGKTFFFTLCFMFFFFFIWEWYKKKIYKTFERNKVNNADDEKKKKKGRRSMNSSICMEVGFDWGHQRSMYAYDTFPINIL